MTAQERREPQRPTDHVHPLPASVLGRGTADGDPNMHLIYDQPEYGPGLPEEGRQ